MIGLFTSARKDFVTTGDPSEIVSDFSCSENISATKLLRVETANKYNTALTRDEN